MKYFLIVLILLFLSLLSFAQEEKDIWTVCYEEEEYLMGFENHLGEVMIEPKLMGYTVALKFDKIMGVFKKLDTVGYERYYLLKDGTRFGQDSMYIHDFAFDCEREGFIKFMNPKTELVGMFNEFGKVAIPAEYSGIGQLHNGLVIALKGAKKKHWDHGRHSGCDHWSWKGGTELLIDTDNQVLIENFDYKENIDYYSLEIAEEKSTEEIRINFKGKDGCYYSFVDYELLFKDYIFCELLDNFSKEKLLAHSYKEIVFHRNRKRTLNNKDVFVNKNFSLIAESLNELNSPNCKYVISIDDYVYLPDDLYEEFEKFYDNCGSLNSVKYPVLRLSISHSKERKTYENEFSFFKFEDGFKLIDVDLKNP